MTSVVYDGTYEGWLTAVFDIYEYKLDDVVFAKGEQAAAFLFGTRHEVTTEDRKAKRVLKGLQQRLSSTALKNINLTFLSEIDYSEDIMLRFVRYAFSSGVNVEQDLANRLVWEVWEAARRVRKEAHRMEAFVRFKLTKDDLYDPLYYAVIEPQCDVLPLISDHFKNRYADQRWLIYDLKRKYGIYYDLEMLNTVEVQFSDKLGSAQIKAELCDEREEHFQNLWCRYFGAVNIEARKNLRLQMKHMPKRYWKYLTEKMPDYHRS
ncbi:TIGR03915 family putative DNA repair protein [Desertivirga xinjiangensis]|uniref:TIGR03915 family putative DNA repair protein n=1 Tax=Desertivirga xinjiangensis TaxID=539206 RepID=UPI00210E5B86|nr:TIGR03915 family putative DNA repair protein [Pedobacter xinjiangensis]